MERNFRKIFALLLFTVLAGMAASAQMITSTLVGQVNDPAGNGVPRATITVKNEDTGIPTQGITSSTGSYSIAGLLPGTYSVTVQAPGFATFKQKGIVINSATSVRIDATLKVGSTQQTVEVTGAAPLLHTDSPTIGTTLNEQQIRNLPSAVQGVGALLATVPGANIGPDVPLAQPQISGATHWGASNFIVDGVSVDDLNNGGASYAYPAGNFVYQTEFVAQPPTDTLQEFRTLYVNENAEFRSPGTVIMVTKSGANQFHGDLYEFLQNAALNANTYQLNASGKPRPKSNLNQFGGSVGGPIWKNKAFFFFAPSYFRQLESGLSQRSVPSQAMRQGDFSALEAENTQLYDPYTGQPFVDNQIPTSRFSPQSVALMKYMPEPTVAGSTGLPSEPANYRESVPIRDYSNSYTGRVDYQIDPSDRIFAVYRQAWTDPWEVFKGGPPQFGNETNFGFSDKSVIAAETHTFSSTALNDFHASWFVHNSFRVGQNNNFDPTTLFPDLTPGNNRGLPTVGASGYSELTQDYGGAGTESPIYSVAFLDNFTKVLHNHSIKAGFEEAGYKSFQKKGTGSLGSFSFTGAWTGNQGWPAGFPHSQGNGFADFLLGTLNAASRSTVAPDAQEYNRIYGAYIQDTWQATPHLTLSYGIRYMYQGSWTVRNNARSYFDEVNNKIALPENSATPTLPPLGNETFFNNYYQYLETTQSIGLPTHYMQPARNNWAPRLGFAYRPFSNTVIRGGYGIYYNYLIQDFGGWGALNLPFGSNTDTASTQRPGKPTSPYLPDITFASPFENPKASLSLHPTIYSEQRNLKNAMVQQYSLTVEHQFGQNWMFRSSYVGSITHQLPWFEMDINQPAVQIPNTPYQDQRPFQPWGTINSVRFGAVQNYNQLQVEAKRRYFNGISLDVNYSWSRSLDNANFTGGPQQIRFPALDYGNTEFVRANTLVANFLYALPFGRGKMFLGHDSGFVNALVGGWQASGIISYASGDPFSVSFAVPGGFTGWAGGRADRIPGVPVYIRNHGHNVIQGVPWFNPKAFGPPQPWTWGTSARNSLWGPGLSNWDLSAMKQVSTIGDRVHVTLRADFLDAFNHFNPGNPSATVPSPQYGGLPIPTAGMIHGGSGNRYIQLSLRTSF